MKKIKNNQSGFGTVEIILIVVIITLLGVVGWFVYDKNKDKTENSTTAASTQPDKTPTTEKDTSNKEESFKGTAYTSQNKKFTVILPDGWKLESMKGDDYVYAWEASSVKYAPGKPSKVTVVEGGRDGSSMAFSLYYSSSSDAFSYLSPQLKKVKSYTTVNNIAVIKYSRTQTKEPAPDTMDLPKGTVEYTYDLNYKGKKMRVTHDVLSGETDQSELVEQTIETVKFF